jgi:uncharacterized protein (TIGR03437 family)
MWNRNIAGVVLGLVGLCSGPQYGEVQPAPSGRVIAAGDSHSLALALDGTVWEWGGPGALWPQSLRLAPVQVGGLAGVVSVAGDGPLSLALKDDGTVWRWFITSAPVQSTRFDGIVSITDGPEYDYALALKEDGTVWNWAGAQVSGLAAVVSIAGSASHGLALKSDGTVWAWGGNRCGQLGDGTTLRRSTPVQVSGLIGVVAIAAGGTSRYPASHSLALKSDGTVWEWGCGGAVASSTPVQVSGLTAVAGIAAGAEHSLALKNDGTIWAWGSNCYGQLGDGTGTCDWPPIVTTPVEVSGLTGVVAVAAGGWHSLAVKEDGTVWAWGWNEYGQLGDGTTTNRLAAVRVSGLPAVFPTPVVNAVVNAASFRAGPVAPEEIVSIFGEGIGPLHGASGQTRVLFDGVDAAVIFAAAGQVNAVVPDAVAGKQSTELQVEYGGVRSSPLVLDVADSAPGLFTADATGSGQGAILNQDGSLNSVSNPAPRGSLVVLFATGEGQASLPPSVRIGGQDAEVQEVGGAPGVVAGVLQVKVRIPEAVTPGPAVPVMLLLGEARSQEGVTLAIQ